MEELMTGFHMSGVIERMRKMKKDGETQRDTCGEGEEEAMWQELKSNDFCFKANAGKGNKLASRFQRALARDEALAEAYKSAKGFKAKATLRSRWAEGEYESYVKKTPVTHS